MKLIHCADLHLDSPLLTNLSPEKAKERREEVLHSFERLVQYAEKEQVGAILIAGDLFDREPVSVTVRDVVLYQIRQHPQIEFFYLKGNHDAGDCLSGRMRETPENLHLFGEGWTQYCLGEKIRILGTEKADGENLKNFPKWEEEADSDNYHILMLHGQIAEGGSDTIDLRLLRGRGVDYLALGHIHSFRKGPLDARGILCYPGCLDGRGFDECGEHGFVLLDISEEGYCRQEFVPFASRRLFCLETDISGCAGSPEILDRILLEAERAGCRENSLLRVKLCGEIGMDCEKDLDYLQWNLKERFYSCSLEDESRDKISWESFLGDVSLRGEFVRQVSGRTDFAEEEKARILKLGLKVLSGEELK